MKVIAFVGMPGAGKSLASSWAADLGYEVIYLGKLTMEELKKRELEVTEANEKMVRESLREELGMDAFAKKAAEKMEELGEEKYALDGVRSYQEYEFLKGKYGEDFSSIAFLTSPKVRHARLKKRMVRPLTEEESRSRDKAELDKLKHADTIAMADYYIINNGDMKEFKEKLEGLIKEIEKS